VDVWRDSAVFARIREEEPGGKCGRCEYRLICGGCRARAYADTGDYMGPDESCAYDPPNARAEAIRPRAPTYGSAPAPGLEWSPAAEERLAGIPSFVRGVVMGRVEEYARRAGKTRITPELMERMRREMPVDFSKRMPFFLRGRS
jgi:hypothetical protein